MSLRTSISLGAALVGALVIAYTLSSQAGTSLAMKAQRDRKPAPDFTLHDARGADLRLSDYKGKVVLLNFWATWCGPCNVEIPWFVGFENAYRDRGFAVIGISLDEDGWQAVQRYTEEKKLNYRIAIGNDAVSQMFGGINSLPTTLMIDRNGRVAAAHTGLVSRSTYEEEIRRLL